MLAPVASEASSSSSLSLGSSSILSGRYPFGVGYYDMKGPEVVPTSFDLTPALLKKAGYTTAALGKWKAAASTAIAATKSSME